MIAEDPKKLYEAMVKGDSPDLLAPKLLENMHMREALLKCVFRELNFQCDALCKLKDGQSLLRQSTREDLMEFNFVHLIDEWKGKAPLLLTFLRTVSNSPKNEQELLTSSGLTGLCMAGSILLRQRNTHMSALHHMVGIVLHHGNASKMVLYYT